MSEHTKIDPNTLVSVSFDGEAITIIDQTKLPGSLEYLRLTKIEALIDAIRELKVRGAPAIGIAGAYGIAMALAQVCDDAHGATCTAKTARRRLAPIAEEIRTSRPTAVNLAWAVDRMLRVIESAGEVDLLALRNLAVAEAEAIHGEDAASCLAMAELAQEFFGEGTRALTHCNTGLLCTGGIGTALGAIRVAHERGSLARATACETRPLLQGARLTAWELGILGISHDLIVDSAASGLMARGEFDLVIVGADRIAANGDTANKVGTYSHALAAHAAGIPFIVVAPQSTIDPSTADGASIEVEERPGHEVGVMSSRLGRQRNPAFDVTPAALITAIVTESGVHRPPYRFQSKA